GARRADREVEGRDTGRQDPDRQQLAVTSHRDLVVLGNLLVDDMVFPDGRTRMSEPGGATLYATLGASLWGLSAGVASVRGDDYPAFALDALTARGVDLAGVRPLDRPGLRTW